MLPFIIKLVTNLGEAVLCVCVCVYIYGISLEWIDLAISLWQFNWFFGGFFFFFLRNKHTKKMGSNTNAHHNFTQSHGNF